jgi:ABC transporter/Cation transporting ATPase, C-terminus
VCRWFGVGGTVVKAVDDINLHVDEAAFVVVLGPSGSGKTTLLNLIGALDAPTAGTIRLNGQDLTTASRAQRTMIRRHSISFVFQSFNLFPALTALENVQFGAALRRADIGVAMGKLGTEVARQAADLVLADDNLRTVVTAAEEGRRVYGNIRRFLLYALSGGSAEIAVMLAGPALGLALPLLPAQILWVNLLTHGLPGVALGGEHTQPLTGLDLAVVFLASTLGYAAVRLDRVVCGTLPVMVSTSRITL